MTLFFALCLVGVAIAGFSAFLIFWPLTLVHLRDRHPALADDFAFLKPQSLRLQPRQQQRAHSSSRSSSDPESAPAASLQRPQPRQPQHSPEK